MKVLHSADWHPREKDIEEAEKCQAFLIDVAEREEVDLIILAGDTFSLEATNKIDSLIAKLTIKNIRTLSDIAPVAIVIGTNSHDGLAPEIFEYVRGHYPVIVAAKPIQVYLSADGFATAEDNEGFGLSPYAVLTLIPTPTKRFFQTESGIAESNEEISQAMNGLFAGFGAQAHAYPDIPHILVGHWNVSGSILSTGQVMTGKDIDIGYDQMMLACPDLICLGHIHKAQKIGERAFYPGSLYPLTWGELEPKGFWLHEILTKDETISGFIETESRFIETPCKKQVRFEDDFTVNPIEDFENGDGPPPGSHEGDSIRYDIKVWQDEAVTIPKELIIKRFKDSGALDVDIRIIHVPRQTVRSESVLKVNTLRDKIKAMADLREETVTDEILKKADLLEVAA